MMNYHHDNRNRRSQYAPSIILIIIGVGVVLVLLISRVGGGLTRLDTRVWDVQVSFAQSVRTLATSKKSLLQDIRILEERVNALEIERLQFEALQTDQQQSSGLGAPDRVIALVTTRPPETLYDSFIIDRGSNDNVHVGDMVYLYDRIIFGTIVSVSRTTAKVVAFSSSGQGVSGYHGVSKTTLELHGRGNGSFEVEVPREIDIVEGDVLVDQSTARNVIGVVEYIVTDERDPFKRVYVRIPANMNSIRYLQIEGKDS